MDAVEFLKAWRRMCKTKDCENCEADEFCRRFITDLDKPEKLLSVVEEWEKEHPVKTRQDEFLEHYPNAKLNDAGRVKLCPLSVDKNYNLCDLVHDCFACKDYYWSQEIE